MMNKEALALLGRGLFLYSKGGEAELSQRHYKIPRYQVSLVRESSEEAWEPVQVMNPKDAVNVVRPYLETMDRETFITIQLDAKNRIIGDYIVSVGDLSRTSAHPREVFKVAILQNAASIICVHNHPSGDPEPSPEDIELTKNLELAGKVLGIKILDHIIIGHDGKYVSMKEREVIH